MRLNKPTNLDEAKGYACTYTTRRMTKEETEKKIQEYKNQLESRPYEDLIGFYKEQIQTLSEWLASKEFAEGNYHQSIDELLLELVEWRAMFYAFQTVDTASDPFNTHVFFQQWKVGGAYAMFSQFAKLVSGGTQDKSLRNLWRDLQPFLETEIKSDEIAQISKYLQKEDRRFSNSESKALAFRNKVIAHNEKSIDADFDHLDEDIKLIARIWAIITNWSSFGLIAPWRSDAQAFSGLENFYTPEDLQHLKRARQEYIKKFEAWGKTNILTLVTARHGPFDPLTISWKSTTIA